MQLFLLPAGNRQEHHGTEFPISISELVQDPGWTQGISFATSACLEIAVARAAPFLKKPWASLRISESGLILSQLKEVVNRLAVPRLSTGRGIHRWQELFHLAKVKEAEEWAGPVESPCTWCGLCRSAVSLRCSICYLEREGGGGGEKGNGQT